MSTTVMSTREKFLARVMETKTRVKVFLSTGTMLEGRIVDFDKDDIVVEKTPSEQSLVSRANVVSVALK